MPSRADLQRLANRERVGLGVLEKDYVLTQVLGSLSLVPKLREDFVFKGGTALRKVYFPDWRYSEDLDFTVKRDMAENELQKGLEDWYLQVEKASGVRLTTKMLYKPNGYARARIQYVGPLAYPAMIYMDLTFDEPLCLEPAYRNVLTSPFVGESRGVLVYPLEELMAEKLRALLERGKSRDYYDVWRLLKEHVTQLNLEIVGTVLKEKLEHKGLNPSSMDEFLPAAIDEVKRYWDEDLGQQVGPLPAFELVIEELRDLLTRLVAPYVSLHP